MAKMPRIPSLTGSTPSATLARESVLDEIEDAVLGYVEDEDVAKELADAIGDILDEMGWEDG